MLQSDWSEWSKYGIKYLVSSLISLFLLRYRAQRWNGVWTLILLTSGLILYISFGLLHCVHLPLDSDPYGIALVRVVWCGVCICISVCVYVHVYI